MDWHAFSALPVDQVARLVRDAGSRVCALPIDGTRRWFHLEAMGRFDAPAKTIIEAVAPVMAAFYRMLFDHGWDTLLLPSLGQDLLDRSPDYAALSTEGFLRLVSHPLLLDLYREYGIRVRFYGDYRERFEQNGLVRLSAALDELAARTPAGGARRIFFGLFGHDATETIGRMAVEHYLRTGCLPARKDLVTAYYGEEVDPVSIFIGFDKCSAYDMPLLNLGREDLYFTVAPSLYLRPAALREILYDHLFTRRAPVAEYTDLAPEAMARMRSFYAMNRSRAIGVGMLRDGIWYPLPQVSLPPAFESDPSAEQEQ